MFDGQHRLDQARHSGSRVEVADIGLHRSERAIAAPVGAPAESLGQRCHLDRISERRARAVSLDVADLIGVMPAILWPG